MTFIQRKSSANIQRCVHVVDKRSVFTLS